MFWKYSSLKKSWQLIAYEKACKVIWPLLAGCLATIFGAIISFTANIASINFHEGKDQAAVLEGVLRVCYQALSIAIWGVGAVIIRSIGRFIIAKEMKKRKSCEISDMIQVAALDLIAATFPLGLIYGGYQLVVDYNIVFAKLLRDGKNPIPFDIPVIDFLGSPGRLVIVLMIVLIISMMFRVKNLLRKSDLRINSNLQ